MRGSIQVLQVSLQATVLWECLADVANELINGSAKRRRILALVSLENTQRLINLHNFLNKLIYLLFHNILIFTKLPNDAALAILYLINNGIIQIFIRFPLIDSTTILHVLGNNFALDSFLSLLNHLLVIIGELLCQALHNEGAEELQHLHLDPVVVGLELH